VKRITFALVLLLLAVALLLLAGGAR